MSSADERAPEPPRPADAAGLDPAATIAGPAEAIPELANTQHDAPPQGWWARNWRTVVLAASITPVALCGLCGLGCLGLMRFSSTAVRHMEPYRLALETVQGSGDLQRIIGEPIEAEDSFLAAARARLSKTEDGANQAEIFFVVVGLHRRANVAAKAIEKDDYWRLSQLEALPVGGERMVILAPSDEAPTAVPGDE